MDKSELKSNPFDVLLQHSLELARTSLFFVSRYRDESIPENIRGNGISQLEDRMELIRDTFEVLESFDDETIKALRKVSYINKDNNMNSINDYLLKLHRDISTEYSRIYPFVSEEFEIVTYGVDSDKFKYNKSLRDLCTDEVTDDFLIDCLQLTDEDSDTCKEDWQRFSEIFGNKYTDEYCDKCINFVEKNSLSENDLEYMRSYIVTR